MKKGIILMGIAALTFSCAQQGHKLDYVHTDFISMDSERDALEHRYSENQKAMEDREETIRMQDVIPGREDATEFGGFWW